MADSKQVALRKRIGDMDLAGTLPSIIPSEKFKKIVLTQLTLNPALYNVTEVSLLSSVMKAAADGLVLDGREAALIIFRSKGGDKAQYLPMAAGIIKKVRQSGEVAVLNATLVRANDEFKIVYGLNPDLIHIPKMEGERGDIIGCYAVCKFKDGNSDFEYMPKADIEAIRSRSKAKNTGPWVSDYGEMCRKTLIHRLCKRLPMSADAQDAVSRIEDMYDMTPDSNYVDPGAKKAGAGAAALNPDVPEDEGPEDEGPTDIEDAEFEEVPPEETAAQKKSRLKAVDDMKKAAAAADKRKAAKKAKADKLREELAAAEAEEEESENPAPAEDDVGEDVI